LWGDLPTDRKTTYPAKVVKSDTDKLEVGTVDADSAEFSLETDDLAELEALSSTSMIDPITC
jgi:hypothetical protein